MSVHELIWRVGDATHGHSRVGKRSKTYTCWAAMKQRCGYPGSISYRWYGERGIKVCERWMTFENFLADMGEKPPGTSIDRINNDGNYEPSNCRWSNPKTQSNNRRPATPGLMARGEGRSDSKLNDNAVREIRRLHAEGVPFTVLAKRFGVTDGAVRMAAKGLTWRHVQ